MMETPSPNHSHKGRGIVICFILTLWCSLCLAQASNEEKEAFYSQAWSKFEEGNFEEAQGLFAEFKNKFTDPVLSEEADYKIAECLYNLKDYPRLKDHLRLLFEKYPATPLLRFYLAEGCFYDREYPCAIENYQQALESISDSYLKNSLPGSGLELFKTQ